MTNIKEIQFGVEDTTVQEETVDFDMGNCVDNFRDSVENVLDKKSGINIIKDIYKNNSSSLKSFESMRYTESLNIYIDRIEGLSISNFSIDSLEGLKFKTDISIILFHIGVNNLKKYFGEKVLLWTSVNYVYLTELSEKFEEDTMNLLGLDSIIFEKARLVMWNLKDFSTDIEGILKNYVLIDYINKDLGKKIDLNKYLEENKNDNIKKELSEKRKKDYRLVVLNTDKLEEGYVSTESMLDNQTIVYLDSPIGISLFYKNNPNAVIGVKAKGKDTLQIVQLQGIQPKINNKITKTKGLHILKWKEMLVNIVEEIALELGFKEIEIISWENNKRTKELYPKEWKQGALYSKEQAGKPHLDKQRAINIYDKTALELGYSINNKTGDYIKVF